MAKNEKVSSCEKKYLCFRNFPCLFGGDIEFYHNNAPFKVKIIF